MPTSDGGILKTPLFRQILHGTMNFKYSFPSFSIILHRFSSFSIVFHLCSPVSISLLFKSSLHQHGPPCWLPPGSIGRHVQQLELVTRPWIRNGEPSILSWPILGQRWRIFWRIFWEELWEYILMLLLNIFKRYRCSCSRKPTLSTSDWRVDFGGLIAG